MFMQHCCSSKSCISCLHSSSTKREKKSLRVQHSVSQTSEQKRVLISLTCFGFNKINNRGTTMKQPSKQEWFYRREPLTLFPHLFCLFFHQCCIWLGSVPLVIACGDTWSYRHCTSTVVLLQDGKSMCAVVRRFRLCCVSQHSLKCTSIFLQLLVESWIRRSITPQQELLLCARKNRMSTARGTK